MTSKYRFNAVVDVGAKLAPWIGCAALLVALAANHFESQQSPLAYALAIATFLFVLVVSFAYTFSPKGGLRSREQRGFKSNRDALRYHVLLRGYRPATLLLLVVAAIMMIISGWTGTGTGLLSFAAAGVGVTWSVVTRRWPSDRR